MRVSVLFLWFSHRNFLNFERRFQKFFGKVLSERFEIQKRGGFYASLGSVTAPVTGHFGAGVFIKHGCFMRARLFFIIFHGWFQVSDAQVSHNVLSIHTYIRTQDPYLPSLYY